MKVDTRKPCHWNYMFQEKKNKQILNEIYHKHLCSFKRLTKIWYYSVIFSTFHSLYFRMFPMTQNCLSMSKLSLRKSKVKKIVNELNFFLLHSISEHYFFMPHVYLNLTFTLVPQGVRFSSQCSKGNLSNLKSLNHHTMNN